jgi:hypothetical protein
MRKVLVSLLALAGLITVGMVSAPAVVAGATTGSSIYDSTLSPLPGNMVSEAFAATETSELGNQVKFSTGSGRVLTGATVTLSSWGCEGGSWSTQNCSTTPGATFAEPITLNLYNVGAGGTAVGTRIATLTQTFNVPYRPSADTNYMTDCQADATQYSEPISDFNGTWYDAADGHCYNGFDTNVTFTFGHTRVPNSLIYGVAYNTSNYGTHPYGDSTTCYTAPQGCGYDSLNVALSNEPNNPSVGSDPQVGTVYEDTNYAPYYCDNGAAGVGVFRQDAENGQGSCWGQSGAVNTGDGNGEGGSVGAPYYIPAVDFNAISTAAPTITSAASKTVTKGHAFSFTVNTTGIPVPTLKQLKTLPHGVTFTAHSGGTATLAGTATVAKVDHLEIQAKNSRGTATQNFTLTVKS